MKRLWTPWRIGYLKAPKGAVTGGCIFCDKVRADPSQDRENLLLRRGNRALIAMNLYPYTNGHLMVAPCEHRGELELLDGDTLKEMMILVSQGIRALRETVNPHGFNVGANLGRVAGAGVEDHVHFHIVPRWTGDTDFMTIISDTRKIPELLTDTYDSLRAALEKISVVEKAG